MANKTSTTLPGGPTETEHTSTTVPPTCASWCTSHSSEPCGDATLHTCSCSRRVEAQGTKVATLRFTADRYVYADGEASPMFGSVAVEGAENVGEAGALALALALKDAAATIGTLR